MRYAALIVFLFFAVSVSGQLSQFRMVGSGSWGTVDDSTHFSTVTFAADLTANSFLPTGITDTMRLFTQRGQLYRIDSVGAKTFSTAVLYVVELGGDWGKPSGQVMAYETLGLETVPAVPFATNGATAKLQEAVITYNAGKYTGVSNSTIGDSMAIARSYADSKDAVLSARLDEVDSAKDTVNQASHGFSVGDPVWKSGDYILSLDTGLTVRVDGIVVDSINANFFVVQRFGRFTLTGHGFTVDQQLYVQPDGSYSATNNANSLVYGFAIDANTIQIGATTEGVRAIGNYFDNSISGRTGVRTKQEMLDSLAGFQSFADLTSLQSALPKVGYTVEDRSTNIRYKVINDSIPGVVVDGVYQIQIGGNYGVSAYLPVNVNSDLSYLTSSSAISNAQTLELKINYTSPILDRVGTGDGYAFSIRQIKSDDTEPIVTVENESGDTLNVYHSGGILDTAAIHAFAGTDSIFVRQWWNKARAVHIRQTKHWLQPIIGLNGEVILDAQGNPTIWFKDRRHLINTTATISASALSYSAVYQRAASGVGVFFSSNGFGGSNNTSWGMLFRSSGGFEYLTAGVNGYLYNDGPFAEVSEDSTQFNSVNHVFAVLSQDTAYLVNDGVYQVDTSKAALETVHREAFAVGTGANLTTSSTFSFKGYISEVIVFTSDKTSDESIIFDDVEGYYNTSESLESSNPTTLRGNVITLPDPATVDQNKKVIISHLDTDGLVTTVKTTLGSFRVGSLALDSIEISAGLSSNITLQARNIDSTYFWDVAETNDIQFIPGSDTVGVIFMKNVADVSSMKLPIGKVIQSGQGAKYRVEGSRNANFSSPFSYETANGNFAVYQPTLGYAPINDIPFSSSLSNKAKIQLLADYLYEQQQAGTIYIEGDYIVTDTGSIRLPENVSIAGNYSTFQDNNTVNGSRLIFNKPDSTDAIITEHRAQASQYRPGNVIRNIQLIGQSPMRSMINVSSGNSSTVQDVYINAPGTYAGVMDERNPTVNARSLFNEYINVDVRNCEYGFHLDGNTQSIKGSSVLFGTIGALVTASKTSILDSWFEDLDSSAIISTSDNLIIDNIYIETVCNECQNDSTAVAINILGGIKAVVQNSLLASGDSTITIGLDTITNFSLLNSRVQGAENMAAPNTARTIVKTSRTGRIEIKGNSSLSNIRWNDFYNRNNLSEDEVIYVGNGSAIDRFQGENIPELRVTKSLVKKSHFNGITADGDYKIVSDTIQLQGPHNLISYSDQLDQISAGNWTNFAGLEVIVTANDTIGPTGTTNAELIVSKSSGGNRLAHNIDSTILEKNEWYVFRFWARAAGIQESQYMIFQPNDWFLTGTVDTFFLTHDWQQFSIPLKTTTSFSTGAHYLGWAFSPSDTFHVANVDFYQGIDINAQYVTTAASEVTSTNVVLDGSVTITGELVADPSYFFTTGSATPTTDLGGEFSITHGLGATPTHVSISNASGTEYAFEIVSRGATTFVAKVYDGTGTGTTVNSTGISITWAAFK